MGRPSAPKAAESQRHQSSMTSPLPEHHSMLIIASCRALEEHTGFNQNQKQGEEDDEDVERPAAELGASAIR